MTEYERGFEAGRDAAARVARRHRSAIPEKVSIGWDEACKAIALDIKSLHPPAPEEGFEEWHARECPNHEFCENGPDDAWSEGEAPARFVGRTCREVYEAEHPPQAEQAAREGGCRCNGILAGPDSKHSPTGCVEYGPTTIVQIAPKVEPRPLPIPQDGTMLPGYCRFCGAYYGTADYYRHFDANGTCHHRNAPEPPERPPSGGDLATAERELARAAFEYHENAMDPHGDGDRKDLLLLAVNAYRIAYLRAKASEAGGRDA